MKITTASLVAMTIAMSAVLGLSGCASTIGRSGSAVGPEVGSQRAQATSPLPQIVDLRKDMPGDYKIIRDPGPLQPRSYDDALHSCVGVPTTSSDVVGRASFGAWHDGRRAGAEVDASVVRYRSQSATDQDAALLLRARAADCYRTVLLRQLRRTYQGAGIVADRTAVRPRDGHEAVNVAGVVRFDFHTTLGGHHPGYATIVLVTGPRTFGFLGFLGFGRAVSASTQDRMTAAFAARVAEG